MTSDEKKRAMLDFGDEPTPPAIPPVDPEAIKAATRAAGFRETPKVASPAPSHAGRRTRRKTGRTEQFATRLRAETLDAIHVYADDHEITLSETIERAMNALSQLSAKGS